MSKRGNAANISAADQVSIEKKRALELKKKLAEMLVEEICPVGKEITKLMADETYLQEILKKGSEKANIKAEENLKIIRDKVGLI